MKNQSVEALGAEIKVFFTTAHNADIKDLEVILWD
jgi:hypothetical protein